VAVDLDRATVHDIAQKCALSDGEQAFLGVNIETVLFETI
jgi:hypothetical protein